MPLIIPTNEPGGRWDRTPRSWIYTRRYRVGAAPGPEKARAIQREAYDWALRMMDENPNLKVRAKGDSLWARLTQARRDGTVPKAPLGLQRAAPAQAHTVFQMLEQHWKDWAGKAGQEQDEKVSGRLLRGRNLEKTPPHHLVPEESPLEAAPSAGHLRARGRHPQWSTTGAVSMP